jgi:hypothetical protein
MRDDLAQPHDLEVLAADPFECGQIVVVPARIGAPLTNQPLPLSASSMP